jgi:glutamine amidotransferase
MCLIIHRPMGCEIPADWLDNALEHNADGWGIMASDGKRLHIVRGLASKGFHKRLPSFDACEVFIHFRYATHGKADIGNCHPFTILDGEYAVMHNGVIPIDCSSNPARSDTWHYCERILTPMLAENSGDFTNPEFAKLIGEHVGITNKLTILRHDGASIIVNADQGETIDGMWFSNLYSLYPCQRSVWRWDDAIDLDSLRKMDRDELIRLCWDDPEMVADAILDDRRDSKRDWHDWDYR